MKSLCSVASILIFYILSSLISLSHNDSIPDEELFLKHFPTTNATVDYHVWTYPDKWFREPSQHKLKRFCSLAHRKSGRGPCQVNIVLYQMRLLSFEDATDPPRHIDVLEYGCQEGAEPADIEDHWLVTVDDRWYITEGTTWDCVFYLTRVNASVEYIINEHVCGIKIFELIYTLLTDDNSTKI